MLGTARIGRCAARAGSINADHALMVTADAEAQTGIGHQQVPRFRKSLSDADRYRARVILAAYRVSPAAFSTGPGPR
jgi:hypothetical protein